MAGRKRVVGRSYEYSSSSTSSSDTSDACSTKKAKRQVSISTFEKWQQNFDREHQTLTWLRCDKDQQDRDLVSLLWCAVCREFQNRICSMKNYSRAWVTGSTNQRTSNLLDHVASEQHKAAMAHHRTARAKANNEPVTSYAPIARCLLSLEESERSRMRNKFDMCYWMAKEGIAFEKYPSLCELETKHEVDVGHAYKTAPSAITFTHYIAEHQRQQFLQFLSQNKFYSFLMDGSTDSGKVGSGNEVVYKIFLCCLSKSSKCQWTDGMFISLSLTFGDNRSP